jgi:hypothetical protein
MRPKSPGMSANLSTWSALVMTWRTAPRPTRSARSLGPSTVVAGMTMRSAVRGLPASMGSNQSSAQLNRSPMSGQRNAATAAS